MTKLEEKLIELGYDEQPKYNSKQIIILYLKDMFYGLAIYYNSATNKIVDNVVLTNGKCVRTQKDIDYLQQAFNLMQKDLEELKKYENWRNL